MDDIMVSVICLTYNHEKYIRQCLESLVNQQTSFKYEVFVHDDASTDGTADIIREYANSFPMIIRPIYQTENQYSQGIRIVNEYILPHVKGKYLAWCEGDDYWTETNKLQAQVAFLEKHRDYVACFHRTETHKLFYDSASLKSVPYTSCLFPLTMDKDTRVYAYDIITQRKWFHTSSFIMLTELYRTKPSCFEPHGNGGDYLLFIRAAMEGKVYYFSDVMSVYNYGVPGSWTLRLQDNKEKALKNAEENIKSLKRISHYYGLKHRFAFAIAILKIQYSIYIRTGYTRNALFRIYHFAKQIAHKYRKNSA